MRSLYRGAKRTGMAEERFMALEVKVAYLERLAGELSDVVAAQDRQLDELVRRLAGFEKQMAAATPDPPDGPPPHY